MLYVKLGDKFIFHSELAGVRVPFKVMSINEFRPPNKKYEIEFATPNRDVLFVGDEWFEMHNDQIDRYLE